MLDELDYALLNALQVQPRAPWALLASVLGIDPATVARRWERLSGSGIAWVTCEPPREPASVSALVEIDCQPGAVADIASLLAAHPHVISICITAGARDLLLVVLARTADELNHYLLDCLSPIPQIRRMQTHLTITPYGAASQWRLRALERPQIAQLSEPPANSAAQHPVPGVLDDIDWDIVGALSANGRATTAELATATGVSASTAHRRLHRLLTGGLRLRCEIARDTSGWPISVWLFVRCPVSHRAATGRALTRIPEVRAAFSTAGPFNLVMGLWLRSLADLENLETQLAAKAPHIEIADRAVVIRPIKLVGHLLDPTGYATGVVPLDLRIPTAPSTKPRSKE